MYQDQGNFNWDLVRGIVLNNLYNLIGTSVDRGLYSFKGGFILSKVAPNVRRTGDIDITVLNENSFELVMSSITGYLNSLREKGIIWDYRVTMPIVGNGRNKSGGVKLYVKFGNNSAKRVLCGIDMSIHSLGEGVELTAEGYPSYSVEYMLADKVSVLYKDRRTVIRRIRDVFDIYLIISMCKKLNMSRLLGRFKELGTQYRVESTLEELVRSDYNLLFKELRVMMRDGKRVNPKSIENLSEREVIFSVLSFLTMVRSNG